MRIKAISFENQKSRAENAAHVSKSRAENASQTVKSRAEKCVLF